MGYARCSICKSREAKLKVNMVMYDVNVKGGSKGRTMASSGVLSLCLEDLSKPTAELRKRLLSALKDAKTAYDAKIAAKGGEQPLSTVNKRR